MKNNNNMMGHLAALFTILVWGTTFISTKVLLRSFSPIEILFIRFLIGYGTLWLIFPRKMKKTTGKQEWYFAAAGLCGVTLYYLFENIALTFTLASDVGVIISVAPFFTAIFACIFLGDSRPGGHFFLGFVLAIVGIVLLSISSGAAFAINPLGDFLAVVAAVIWAVYSTLTRKISSFGYPTIPATRRIFFYGLVFMIPVLFVMDFHVEASAFLQMDNLLNLLFLGLGASALCFVTWNFAVKVLGSVKTSVYIYIVPVVTAVTSALILGERIMPVGIIGMALTLAGLFLSTGKIKKEIHRAVEG